MRDSVQFPYSERITIFRRLLLGLAILFLADASSLGADHRCAVCRGNLGYTVYQVTDKVDDEKKLVCFTCSTLKNSCFACGLPVKDEVKAFSDGRYFCDRDLQKSVFDPETIRLVAESVRNDLDRLFSRFMSFPQDVKVGSMDRVDLLKWKIPGNDFECPNILGVYHGKETEGKRRGQIQILSGLTMGTLKATCAHEFTHAWIHANVSSDRRASLGKDAEEGFCELVSFIYACALQDQRTVKSILENAYTRGQVHLFIEAERKYGFNEILDWIRFGNGNELSSANLNSVRDVSAPKPKSTTATGLIRVYEAVPEPAPTQLELTSVLLAGEKSWAWINKTSIGLGESKKVRLGETNVLIQCLKIEPEHARIRVIDTGEELQLNLRHKADSPTR